MAKGIHHVTAIAGAARRNLDFYTRILGLSLVKRTVNFDDPGTHHLYFGDATGAPGTILTFFPWEHAAPGRAGPGEAVETALRVPDGALPAWRERLARAGIEAVEDARFGAPRLAFADPDGMRLAIVAEGPGRGEAIAGVHSVMLRLREPGRTAAILADVLGYAESARDGGHVRFVADAPNGAVIDLLADPEGAPGRAGRGSVHHVAFRAADDAAQAAMVARLAQAHGIATTEQKDRQYFRSVYFREPGGVLFEIATDAPGFAIDEAPDALGRSLKLPPGLEPDRARIEASLPPLD